MSCVMKLDGSTTMLASTAPNIQAHTSCCEVVVVTNTMPPISNAPSGIWMETRGWLLPITVV